jgi:hypothetical protein
MTTAKPTAGSAAPRLFLPSRREALVLALLGAAALGAALFFRYGIVQNTPLGLACEAGRGGVVCAARLAVILKFTFSVFGWGALIAAAIQLWRPNVVTFGIGLVFALSGLVLYNTGASALAFALLLLSLARPAPEAR